MPGLQWLGCQELGGGRTEPPVFATARTDLGVTNSATSAQGAPIRSYVPRARYIGESPKVVNEKTRATKLKTLSGSRSKRATKRRSQARFIADARRSGRSARAEDLARRRWSKSESEFSIDRRRRSGWPDPAQTKRRDPDRDQADLTAAVSKAIPTAYGIVAQDDGTADRISRPGKCQAAAWRSGMVRETGQQKGQARATGTRAIVEVSERANSKV